IVTLDTNANNNNKYNDNSTTNNNSNVFTYLRVAPPKQLQVPIRLHANNVTSAKAAAQLWMMQEVERV
ncbi:MAG: hypothetical protein AAFY20_27780, partial [Cyanobacteria bacterium J06639_14]